MYGKSRGSKGASSCRTNGITANNIARALKKVGGKYTSKKNSAPRFATVGYARNVEKKYFDKQYISNSLEALTGITGNSASNGVTYISNVWGSYNFGAQVASTAISNDMCKGLIPNNRPYKNRQQVEGVLYKRGFYIYCRTK